MALVDIAVPYGARNPKLNTEKLPARAIGPYNAPEPTLHRAFLRGSGV